MKTSIRRVIGVIFIVSMMAALAAGCAGQSGGESIVQDVDVVAAHGLIQNNSDNPDFVILDVRTPAEFADGFIKNAVNIDFNSPTFRDDADQLDRNKTYLVYCRSGNRSASASAILEELGFKDVYNMTGGIQDWEDQGLPVVKPVSASRGATG